jgi:hypothetical protein
MAETDLLEPKTTSVKLDQETRERMASELGLADGINAIPEEIRIVAIDPRESLPEGDDVSGFATLGTVLSANNYFYNDAITPALSVNTLYSRNLLSSGALNIIMRV